MSDTQGFSAYDPSLKFKMSYLYLVYSTRTGMLKIGQSKNPKRRLNTIRWEEDGNDCYLIHTIASDAVVSLENRVHDYFDELRVRGEWFALLQPEVSLMESVSKVIYFNPKVSRKQFDLKTTRTGLPIAESHKYSFLPIDRDHMLSTRVVRGDCYYNPYYAPNEPFSPFERSLKRELLATGTLQEYQKRAKDKVVW